MPETAMRTRNDGVASDGLIHATAMNFATLVIERSQTEAVVTGPLCAPMGDEVMNLFAITCFLESAPAARRDDYRR